MGRQIRYRDIELKEEFGCGIAGDKVTWLAVVGGKGRARLVEASSEVPAWVFAACSEGGQ